MLHTWMEMKAFFYCMIGAAIIGVLCMLIVNGFSKKKVQDKTSYHRFARKLKGVSAIVGVFCLFFAGAAIYGAIQYEYPSLTIAKYAVAGVGMLVITMIFQKLLEFVSRESVIGEFLLNYMEQGSELNSRDKPPEVVEPIQEAQMSEQDAVVEAIMKSIHETAADSSKFSHYLTPEEEGIMREVIREYMT